MKEIRKVLLFLLGSALLGALLAPWLFWGGHALAARGFLVFLGSIAFPRYFDRAMLVAAVLLIWPALRSLRVRNRGELGIEQDGQGWRRLGIGFTSAFVCMAAYGIVLVGVGVFRMRNAPAWTALFSAAFSAAAVALLEEWLFRGVILGFFRRALLDIPAVICTAALFSIVHFLKPPSAGPEVVDWLSGFRVMPSCFAQFADPTLLAAGFSTLFLVGCVLGWAVLRTHSLWLSIGLHAGWVFAKSGFGKIAKRSMADTLPWVGEDLIVGVGALGVVALTWLLAALLLAYASRRRRSPRW